MKFVASLFVRLDKKVLRVPWLAPWFYALFSLPFAFKVWGYPAFCAQGRVMNARSEFLAPRPAPRVELQPDVSKILSAIGFLIKRAQSQGLSITQYDIVKTLFLADRTHLNRFRRPITYDNYVAMYHGPVPSLAYDFLKERAAALKEHGIRSLPWTRASAEHLGKGCYRFFDATTGDEEDVLTPSDIATLDNALTIISGLSFGQVRRLTHSDPAYKEAWAAVGDSMANAMSLGLLFDVPNFEAAEDIKFISEHQSVDQSVDDDAAAFNILKSG